MAFPHTQAPVTVEISPGADPSADPATWTWTSITSYVRVADGITIEGGRRDEGNQVDTTICRLTLNNRDGRFSPRNAEGPWYGQLTRNTPLRVRWDTTDRFVGFVSEWPARWDKSGRDSWVPVEANGVLRRLQQRNKPLLSPLRRRIPTQAGLRAYWPLEDNPGTTQAGSAVEGINPLRVSGFTFEADSDLPGSAPLPTMTAGSSYAVTMPGWSNPTQWEVAFCYNVATPTTANNLMTVITTGTVVSRWAIRVTATTVELRGYSDTDALVVNRSQAALPTGVFGEWARFHLHVLETGSDYSITLRWRGVRSTSSTNLITETVTSARCGSVRQVSLSERGSGANEVAIGHISVWDTELAGYNAYNSADDGWKDEYAESRIVRLCGENDVIITAPGTLTDSAKMGPQPVGTLLDAVRDTENTDGGILYESGGALVYTNRYERYNPPVWLTLDVDSSQVAEPPEPTDDDQLIVNDVLATASSGSFANASDETSIALVGSYEEQLSVNPASDSQLPDIAAWRVHLGTVDEMRWPRISLNFARNPDLIPTWLSFVPGKRLRITHDLAQLPGVDIDVLAEGWTETIEPHNYRVELNCVPTSPWLVGEIEATQTTASFVAANSVNSGNANLTSQTVDLPGGWLPGDVAVWIATVNSTGVTFTPTSGWTIVDGGPVTQNTQMTMIAYRTLQEGDAGPALTISSALKMAGAVVVYRGAYGTAPVIVGTRGTKPGSQTTLAVGPVTTTRASQRVISLFAEKSSTATVITDPGGTTRRVASIGSGGGGVSLLAVDETVATAGATGTRTATYDVASGNGYGIMLALRSAEATATRLDTGGSTLVSGVTSTDTALTVATTTGPAWTTSSTDVPFDIRVAGENITVTAVAPHLQDTFTRTTSNGWGTADSGQAWSTSGGAAGDYSTNGDIGLVAHATTGVRKFTTTGSYTDVELLAEIRYSAAPTGANVIGGLVARYVDDNNSYHCWLVFSTTNTLTLTIAKRVASTFTTLATATIGGTWTMTVSQWIRFRVIGSTLQAKTWQTTIPEPDGWRLAATDTAFTAAGPVGTHSTLLAGNTNFPSFACDTFETVTPQTMTAVRSANGVVKAQSAGAAVRLAHPIILAR